eukprot:Skav224746  [mRNA]  locus=scaffold580:47616:50041:- [translate_table: standard]
MEKGYRNFTRHCGVEWPPTGTPNGRSGGSPTRTLTTDLVRQVFGRRAAGAAGHLQSSHAKRRRGRGAAGPPRRRRRFPARARRGEPRSSEAAISG